MEKRKGSNGLWKGVKEGLKGVRRKMKGLRRDERPK
jgi:hypothetical protein